HESLVDASLQGLDGPLPFFHGEVGGLGLLVPLGVLWVGASFLLAAQAADPFRLHPETHWFGLFVAALGWVFGMGLAWPIFGPAETLKNAATAAFVVAAPTLWLRWGELERFGPDRLRRWLHHHGGEAATWLTLGSRNPVLRYDLVYRLRGF